MGYPDFLIVGAMKAGTTSLSSWLGSQPEVFVPPIKEPNFFSDDRVWNKGLGWYRGLFDEAEPDRMGGEASVAYTDLVGSKVAATRIAQVLPDVKLVLVIRNPVDRLRSHYRHEVLRGRERRPLGEVLRDPSSPYVERSRYFACFEPFAERFHRPRMCVLRFEDLFGATEDGWLRLLGFLELEGRPRPTTRLNASAERAQFTPVMRAAWDAGVRRVPRFVPRVVRRAMKPIFLHDRPDPLLETANDRVPSDVMDVLQADANRMSAWLDVPHTEPIQRSAL
jgi:Sulfotransferase domain